MRGSGGGALHAAEPPNVAAGKGRAGEAKGRRTQRSGGPQPKPGTQPLWADPASSLTSASASAEAPVSLDSSTLPEPESESESEPEPSASGDAPSRSGSTTS